MSARPKCSRVGSTEHRLGAVPAATCTTCGAIYTQAQWEALPVLGTQHTDADDEGPAEDLELRNCTNCGSTLAVKVANAGLSGAGYTPQFISGGWGVTVEGDSVRWFHQIMKGGGGTDRDRKAARGESVTPRFSWKQVEVGKIAQLPSGRWTFWAGVPHGVSDQDQASLLSQVTTLAVKVANSQLAGQDGPMARSQKCARQSRLGAPGDAKITFTIEQLLNGGFTLEQVESYWHRGIIDTPTRQAYLHAWQTGAPRFGRRQCHCPSCKVQYPDPEFSGLGNLGVAPSTRGPNDYEAGEYRGFKLYTLSSYNTPYYYADGPYPLGSSRHFQRIKQLTNYIDRAIRDGKVQARDGGLGTWEADRYATYESDVNSMPQEPEEEDWTTTDHQHFYSNSNGRLRVDVGPDASTATMWQKIDAAMKKANFFPDVWFISDHGNAHLMSRSD